MHRNDDFAATGSIVFGVQGKRDVSVRRRHLAQLSPFPPEPIGRSAHVSHDRSIDCGIKAKVEMGRGLHLTTFLFCLTSHLLSLVIMVI